MYIRLLWGFCSRGEPACRVRLLTGTLSEGALSESLFAGCAALEGISLNEVFLLIGRSERTRNVSARGVSPSDEFSINGALRAGVCCKGI